MIKAPYYIVSDNHFYMETNNQEMERREKLFSVIIFNKPTIIIAIDIDVY